MRKTILLFLLTTLSIGLFSQTKIRLSQIENITNAGIKSTGITAKKVLTSNNSNASLWEFPSWNDLLNKPFIPVSIWDLTNISATGWSEGKVLKFNGSGALIVGTDLTGGAGGGIAYTDLSATSPLYYNNAGVFSVATGYTIPTTTEKGNYDTAFGWGNHSGLYKSINWFPTWSEVTGKPSFITSIWDLTGVSRTGWATDKVLKFNSSGDLVVGNDNTGAGGSGIVYADLGATSPLYYTNTTGVFSVASGYTIPTTTEKGNYDLAHTNMGKVSLTVVGGAGTVYGTLNPTQFFYYQGENKLNYQEPAPYGGYPVSNGSLYYWLGTKQDTITLTTTGTSGASTFNRATGALNIPNYGGSAVGYPGAGIPVSTGSAWGTSINFSTSDFSNFDNAIYINKGEIEFGSNLPVSSGNLYLAFNTKANLAGSLTQPFNVSALTIEAGTYDWVMQQSGTSLNFNQYNTNITFSSSGMSSPGYTNTNATPNTLAYFDANKSLKSVPNPTVDGYVLSSTIAGVRSWVANGSGGSSYTLPATGIGTLGGVKLGFTATGAAVPLQTSSDMGFVTITSDALSTALTGGASTIISSNLTANRALVSSASGKVAVSTVTSTELGHSAGVTSAIQTQLNGKASLAGNQAQLFNALNFNIPGNWSMEGNLGTIRFYNPSGNVYITTAGNLNASGTITGTEVYRGSSKFLKHDIKPYKKSALDMLMKTKIYSYNLNADNSRGVGFIAEETDKILSGENQKRHLMGNHLGILTKAIQEQQEQISDLESRIAQLEKIVNKLQRK